jgi:Flp pilus assembly protein CpaB
LNFSLPFSLHSSELVLIVAALGAIGGLSLFFHGFSLLQQRWPVPAYRPAKLAAHVVTTTTVSTAETQSGPGDTNRESRTRAEIIKLTPHDATEISSASMTQQGRIAAALLKAGVPSPATWSTEPVHTAIRVDEPPASDPTAIASDAEVSRVLQQGASASAVRVAGLNQSSPSHASNWKPSLMIWGGPALTLACIYVLASRLGWL